MKYILALLLTTLVALGQTNTPRTTGVFLNTTNGAVLLVVTNQDSWRAALGYLTTNNADARYMPYGAGNDIGDVWTWNGSIWTPAASQGGGTNTSTGGVYSITFISPLIGGTITSNGNVSISQVSSNVNGYLGSNDFNTLMIKEPAIGEGASNQFWFNGKAWKVVDWSNIVSKPLVFTPDTHSHTGYLTNETDYVYTNSAAYLITSNLYTNMLLSIAWGDHSTNGYITNWPETDPKYSTSVVSTVTMLMTNNWGTAYIHSTNKGNPHDTQITNITGLRADLDTRETNGHGHIIGSVTNLQSSLDGKVSKAGDTMSGNLMLTNNAKFGLGLTNPSSIFHAASDGATSVNIDSGSSAGRTYNAGIAMKRARGTIASPTAVESGDRLGHFIGAGHDGAQYINSASVEFYAGENYGTGNHGSYIDFQTTTNAATVRNSKMRLTGDGKLGVMTTGPTNTIDANGIIGSRSGGFSFPDGTLQATAATNFNGTGMVATNTMDARVSTLFNPAPNDKLLADDELYNAFPSVAFATNGDWLVSYYKSTRHIGMNLYGKGVLIRSSDKGQTWSGETVMVDMSASHIDCRGGSLFVSSTGKMFWWFIPVDTSTELVPWSDPAYVMSTNNGATWSSVQYVTNAPMTVKGCDGRCVQLPNGDILAPFFGSDTTSGIDYGTCVAYVMKSSDDGHTWSYLSTVMTNTGIAYQEHDLLKLKNGVLLSTTRQVDAGAIYKSFSYDDGATWSMPTFTFLGQSHPHAEEISSNLVVIATRRMTGPETWRHNLKWSVNGGTNWGLYDAFFDMGDRYNSCMYAWPALTPDGNAIMAYASATNSIEGTGACNVYLKHLGNGMNVVNFPTLMTRGVHIADGDQWIQRGYQIISGPDGKYTYYKNGLIWDMSDLNDHLEIRRTGGTAPYGAIVFQTGPDSAHISDVMSINQAASVAINAQQSPGVSLTVGGLHTNYPHVVIEGDSTKTPTLYFRNPSSNGVIQANSDIVVSQTDEGTWYDRFRFRTNGYFDAASGVQTPAGTLHLKARDNVSLTPTGAVTVGFDGAAEGFVHIKNTTNAQVTIDGDGGANATLYLRNSKSNALVQANTDIVVRQVDEGTWYDRYRMRSNGWFLPAAGYEFADGTKQSTSATNNNYLIRTETATNAHRLDGYHAQISAGTNTVQVTDTDGTLYGASFGASGWISSPQYKGNVDYSTWTVNSGDIPAHRVYRVGDGWYNILNAYNHNHPLITAGDTNFWSTAFAGTNHSHPYLPQAGTSSNSIALNGHPDTYFSTNGHTHDFPTNGVGGSGTANMIPAFTTTNTLGNSILSNSAAKVFAFGDIDMREGDYYRAGGIAAMHSGGTYLGIGSSATPLRFWSSVSPTVTISSTERTLWHSGNLGVDINATAYTAAERDQYGYINAGAYHSPSVTTATAIASMTGKAASGDGYYYDYGAPASRTFVFGTPTQGWAWVGTNDGGSAVWALMPILAGGSGNTNSSMADGSAASPGLAFSGDPDTGIYRYADNTLSIASTGTNVLDVTRAAGWSQLKLTGDGEVASVSQLRLTSGSGHVQIGTTATQVGIGTDAETEFGLVVNGDIKTQAGRYHVGSQAGVTTNLTVITGVTQWKDGNGFVTNITTTTATLNFVGGILVPE